MSRKIEEAHFAQFGSPHRLIVLTDVPGALWERIGWRHADFLSLYLVRRGKATHVIEGQPFEVARGDVYAMAAGQAHWFDRCERLVLDTIHVEPAVFPPETWELLGQPRSGRWLHLTPAAHGQISQCWSELREEAAQTEGAWLVPALFGRLLVRLKRLGAGGEGLSHGRHEETLASAIRYLDEHFAEPVRIEQLAAQVFLSPDRFTEVFTAAMGRTPRDYLKHLRLEQARTLLCEGTLSLSQIGLLCGFSDPAYFARVFKENLGVSPRQWRDSCKES
ncbi:MAG: AraC family transcriptional regulator [Armatimonadetes bacterium]|nr:AraC family transcriptional regulator [Armatimonadota bacterium]